MKSIHKYLITNQLFYLILMFPIWWFLGVEQFIWFFFVLLIFIQFCFLNKMKFYINSAILIFALFIVIYIISFFNIIESMRYITYFRNLSTYLTSFMILVIIWNIIDEWWQVEKLLKAIVIVMFLSSIIGVLAFSTDFFRFNFKSLMGYIMPSFISETDYGSVIANRNLGFFNWFIIFGEYFRISSFFLYSTMFSATLAFTLPIVLYFRVTNQGFIKKFYTLIFCFMFLALLLTTGRVAIIAFLIGWILFKIISIKSIAIKGSIILISIFIISTTIIILYYFGFIDPLINLMIYSRGEGSANARARIYIETFQGFFEKPIFGWGTERDMKGMTYPLGSHSYYLGTLYKQGILGLVLFLSLLFSIWKRINIKVKEYNKFTWLLKYGQFVLFVYLINSFTDVLDLDATTMMFSWIIFSLLIVANRVYLNNIVNYDSSNSK